MAYVVLFHKDQEIGRRALDGPVVIGRSPECDVSIRDILLSRRHCQIEKVGREWIVSDLGSKNGTRIGASVVTRQALQDGDVVRMGNSTVRFFHGAMAPGPRPKAGGPAPRPADPFEALSGTISAFEFQPRGPARKTDKLPTPRPTPQEPASMAREDVRGMVTELMSSSWDSIYDNAKRQDPVIPQSPMVEALRRKRSREPHVDLALQVRAEGEALGSNKGAGRQQPGMRSMDLPAPRRGWFRALLRKLWFMR